MTHVHTHTHTSNETLLNSFTRKYIPYIHISEQYNKLDDDNNNNRKNVKICLVLYTRAFGDKCMVDTLSGGVSYV